MNLQAQIELITVPQDFMRLCNAVLIAANKEDFLPIDDDRGDRGNDGYLKSEKRMFAAHCFKRIQNQKLDQEILDKMSGDLKKAVKLRDSGDWEVDHWTFLSNYPIPEHIAARVWKAGHEAGIEVSWRGPEYFASQLQEFQHIREMFPNLLGNDVLGKLDDISGMLESLSPAREVPINWIPRDAAEQRALITQAPPAWEYLLYAGVLMQGKEKLELKWRDFHSGYGRRNNVYLDCPSAAYRLTVVLGDILNITAGIHAIFSHEIILRAFGPRDAAGDAGTIYHLAGRIISAYEDLMNWASDIRGTVYPKEFQRAAALAAHSADSPVQDIRDFVDRVVVEFGSIPAWLAQPNRPRKDINITLTLNANDGALNAFTKELSRARKRLRL